MVGLGRRKIDEYFKGRQKQLHVVRILIENGIAIRNGNLYVNQIQIPISSIAQVAGVDRRVVSRIIKEIENNSELRPIFKFMQSKPLTKEIGRYYGFGVLEVRAKSPGCPGLIAQLCSILASHDINIRSMEAIDDPEITSNPSVLVITEGKIPDSLISELRDLRGVSITLYTATHKEPSS